MTRRFATVHDNALVEQVNLIYAKSPEIIEHHIQEGLREAFQRHGGSGDPEAFDAVITPNIQGSRGRTAMGANTAEYPLRLTMTFRNRPKLYPGTSHAEAAGKFALAIAAGFDAAHFGDPDIGELSMLRAMENGDIIMSLAHKDAGHVAQIADAIVKQHEGLQSFSTRLRGEGRDIAKMPSGRPDFH